MWEWTLYVELKEAGNGQLARQNCAINGNILWFSLHQLQGLSRVSKASRNNNTWGQLPD